MKHFLFKTILTLSIVGIALTSLSTTVFAGVEGPPAPIRRIGANDWYIESFDTVITVRQDGGLNIQEDILADCGNCTDRHGIARIVPNRVKTKEGDVYTTPLTLTGITDEQGSAYPYTESINSTNGTVTWKIGDPDISIQGEHHYLINYTVDRAVRDQKTFDELYWNLVGGFWTLGIDQIHATIHLPSTISQKDVTLYSYGGPQGSNEDSKNWLATRWENDHTLSVQSVRSFPQKHDATVSLSFPKGLVTSYTPSSVDTFQQLLAVLIYGIFLFPLAILIACFLYWRKHGKDPKVNKTIIAEYEAPDKLSPLMMRLVQTYGKLDKQGITAGIVDFAINNILIIKETSPAKMMIISAQYSLIKRPESEWKRALSTSERALLNALFDGSDEVALSDLKTSFHKEVKSIERTAEQELADLGYIAKGKGASAGTVMKGVAVVLGFLGYYAFGSTSWTISVSLILSGVIIFLFSLIMQSYTEKGAETVWKIKGFKLYMETVEKYRQQWNEKQNYFEQMLPYAIAFDMTKKWISKMKDLNAVPSSGYMPIWYVGTQPFGSFDELTSHLSAISSEIGSNITTSSGSSGGGFSGGGGGGGGGGGW